MQFQIFNRWSGNVAFTAEIDCAEDGPRSLKIGLAVKWAIETRANLTDADLTDADLTDADLTHADLTRADLTDANLTDANLTRADLTHANLTHADLTRANLTHADLTRADLTDANLTHADLTRADLTDADLTRANLTHADLTDANLTRADLTDANLTRANLTHADLTDADLTRANLTHADLTDANLTRANLTRVRADFFDVLLRARPEIPDLLAALRAGRIDGSTYTGDCVCLAGTIAKSRDVHYETLDFVDYYRPAERWFLGIHEGDTPENSAIAKITEGWIEEFLSFAPTPDRAEPISAGA